MPSPAGDAARELFRQPRQPDTLGLLDLFADLDLGKPGTLPTDPVRIQAVADRVAAGLTKTLAQPQVMYGWRTQRMFERLVEALGVAVLSKSEDGRSVAAATDVRAADHRIVLPDDRTLLVEVKNHHPSNPMKDWTGRASDHYAFVQYCRLAGGEAHYAIYWAPWGIWTLVPAEVARVDRRKVRIDMATAARANRMSQLGDLTVGSEPPLSVRFLADPAAANSITRVSDTTSEVRFTIGSVEVRSAGRVVTDPAEQRIAWFMMLYGSQWAEGEDFEEHDGAVASITFSRTPLQWEERQGFAFVGPLSSMYSVWYLGRTAALGHTIDAAPSQEPGWLGRLIPEGYRGEALRLWLLRLEPSLP